MPRPVNGLLPLWIALRPGETVNLSLAFIDSIARIDGSILSRNKTAHT